MTARSTLIFPELSLTGYEPELAEELAFTIDDSCLHPLIKAVEEKEVSVGGRCAFSIRTAAAHRCDYNIAKG